MQTLARARYLKGICFGRHCMRQVALAHERSYLHPPRRSKAERIAGTHLSIPIAPVDARSDPKRVQFPQRRSRRLVRVADIPGLAQAIRQWQAREWNDPRCPPTAVPDMVECCNYIVLPINKAGTTKRHQQQIVHASEEFYTHPWHDSVLTGGMDSAGNWVESVWMCRCHRAFLFPLPPGCTDQSLVQSATHLGKRKGLHIPLLLVTFMTEFWPWHDPQRAAALPQWLLQQRSLPAYTATKAMRDCGDFLRKYTHVKAWPGVATPQQHSHSFHYTYCDRVSPCSGVISRQ